MIGDGNLLEGLQTALTTDHPEKFKSMGGPTDPVPFYTIFTGMMLVQLFYWGTNQQIIQRALGAKNLEGRSKGIVIRFFYKNTRTYYCSIAWYNCISSLSRKFRKCKIQCLSYVS